MECIYYVLTPKSEMHSGMHVQDEMRAKSLQRYRTMHKEDFQMFLQHPGTLYHREFQVYNSQKKILDELPER